MVPETPSELFQLNTVGLPPEGVDPVPVPIVVQPAESAPRADDSRELFCFETITLAPIDRNLVARDLLDRDEAAWLDAYHARVRSTIGPLVDGETRIWLDAATAPLN